MHFALVFMPDLPLPLLAGLTIAAVLVWLTGVWRRRRPLVPRAAAMALILFALTNPGLVREDRRPLSSVVALVDDETPSQKLARRPQDTAAALGELAAKLGKIPGIEVRRITVTGEGGDGTPLFADIERGLADVAPDRLAAVIAVTDGRVHDVPADPARAGLAAPFHALITGTPAEIDRRVVVKSLPRFGLVGSRQSMVFRVEDAGAKVATGPVPVSIRLNGVEIDHETVTIDRDIERTVTVPHAGPNFVEIATEPVAGGLTPLDARAVATIEGIRQNLKVLLVSGEPHAGERTWRNLLKSDASVDLVHFTILRPPEKQDTTPIDELSLIAFPTRELFADKISQFDLIILDRYQRRGVLPLIYFDNIAQYVAAGGGLLIAAGPDELGPDSIYRSPLGDILPLSPTGATFEAPYLPKLTDLGRRHPVTRDLPGGDTTPPGWSPWFRSFAAAANNGQTVMTGAADGPLLTLARHGKGRIAMLMSDDVWLWARDYAGGGPYLPLLRRLAHWLMQEPDLEEEALRLTAGAGAIEISRQTLGDSVPPVTLTRPDGTTSSLTLAPTAPGLWRGTARADLPGLYSASDGPLTALANSGPVNPREWDALASTTEILKPVADATGGSVRRLRAFASAPLAVPEIVAISSGHVFSGAGWLGLKISDAYEVSGVATLPLASGFYALAALLALVGLMWWREGR